MRHSLEVMENGQKQYGHNNQGTHDMQLIVSVCLPAGVKQDYIHWFDTKQTIMFYYHYFIHSTR